MGKKLNVALLSGGPSAEREVSLQSGASVAQALGSLGHTVVKIDPVPGKLEIPGLIDLVFLALHGTYGEDGQVQSELESLGVPYTGCGAEASRLAFDKVSTKEVLLDHDISTAKFSVIKKRDEVLPTSVSLPIVLKPVGQGSSVGLQFVDTPGEWSESLERAFEHGQEILVEEKVEGRETTVGILAGVPLPIVEVKPVDGRYDYENKYLSGTTEYLCPAPFSKEQTHRIHQTGLKAFLAIGGRDYGRVDIIVRPSGEPVVLEVNTLPGMTDQSLLPKAAEADGIQYEDLCQKMIDLALEHQPCVA